ncbi:MAG: hypothetical protein ACTS8P_01985 [Arsenophonus sp. NC-XBC3-MAG3]
MASALIEWYKIPAAILDLFLASSSLEDILKTLLTKYQGIY